MSVAVGTSLIKATKFCSTTLASVSLSLPSPTATLTPHPVSLRLDPLPRPRRSDLCVSHPNGFPSQFLHLHPRHSSVVAFAASHEESVSTAILIFAASLAIFSFGCTFLGSMQLGNIITSSQSMTLLSYRSSPFFCVKIFLQASWFLVDSEHLMVEIDSWWMKFTKHLPFGNACLFSFLSLLTQILLFPPFVFCLGWPLTRHLSVIDGLYVCFRNYCLFPRKNVSRPGRFLLLHRDGNLHWLTRSETDILLPSA